MTEVIDELKFDWYKILGCNSESSKSGIEKAARKLFLKYHPDKTNDPDAPALFLQVQKAKEILLDDTKRKAIDDAKVVATKRQDYDNERSNNMDVRRKRMRDDLEEILKKGGKGSGSLSQATTAPTGDAIRKTNHAADVDKLRKEGASLREASARETQAKDAQRAYNLAAETNRDVGADNCLIKIKWKRSKQSHSDESLALLFKKFGDVEVVTIIGDKGNSATLLFSNEESASSAVAEYAASTEYRVSIPAKDAVNSKRRADIFTHVYTTNSAAPKAYTGAELFGDAQNNGQESDLMKQIKRAVERDELIRKLQGEPSAAEHLNPTISGIFFSNNVADANPSNIEANIPQTSDSSKKSPFTSVESVTAPSLATKEADVLKRMMEAALLKKKKKAEAASLPTVYHL